MDLNEPNTGKQASGIGPIAADPKDAPRRPRAKGSRKMVYALVGVVAVGILAVGGYQMMGLDNTPPVAPPLTATQQLAAAKARLKNHQAPGGGQAHDAGHAPAAGPRAGSNPVGTNAVAGRPVSAAGATVATAVVTNAPVSASTASAAHASAASSAPTNAVVAGGSAPATTAPTSGPAAPGQAGAAVAAAHAPAAPATPAPVARADEQINKVQAASDSDTNAYYAMRGQISREKSLLQGMADVVALRAKIRKAATDASDAPAAADASLPGPVLPPPALPSRSGGATVTPISSLQIPSDLGSQAAASSGTRLVSTAMVGGRWQATLNVDGGAMVVRTGSQVGRWTVSDVSASSVELRHGKEHKSYSIGG